MRRYDYLIYGDVDTRAYKVGIWGNQLAKAVAVKNIPDVEEQNGKMPTLF